MDGLWDPPNYQETEDSNCVHDGCRCACGLAYDVMEETALNEKSCIQVLRILISKADTDIIELEEELMDLLSELAYTDEEFLDMFTMSLRVKINFLELSIRKLKDDAGDFLSTRKEPAESIHDILKSLFCGYLKKKDEQRSDVLYVFPSNQKSADNTTDVASSCHQVCAYNLLKEKEQGCSSSNANPMEKSKRVITTSLEKHMLSQVSVKMEEEDANYCDTNDFVAPFDNLHYMSPVSKISGLGLCQSSMEKMNRTVNKFQSPTMENDSLLYMTARCKSTCKKPSLETQGKWKHQLKTIKSLTDDEGIGSRSNRLVESSEEPNTMPDISSEMTFSLDGRDESNSVSLETRRALVLSNTQRNAPDTLFEFSLDRINIERPKPRQKSHPNLVDKGNTNLALKQENNHEEGDINSNPEESSVSFFPSLSTRKYKRRQKLDSRLQTSSSSPGLLEGAKELCSLGIDAASLEDSSLDMEYCTLDELRAIAKQRDMKGYSKLRKLDLAQKLGIKLAEGRRKQKRKEMVAVSLTQGEM